SAPQPEQQHRAGRAIRWLAHGAEAQQVDQRQSQDRAGTGLQERTAVEGLAGALALTTNQEHHRSPFCRRMSEDDYTSSPPRSASIRCTLGAVALLRRPCFSVFSPT